VGYRSYTIGNLVKKRKQGLVFGVEKGLREGAATRASAESGKEWCRGPRSRTLDNSTG